MIEKPYPPIGDYAFISDCHSVALVSSCGSIDWCCMPRVDAASVFGRLLDWQRGGYCQVAPQDEAATAFQSYLEGTLVLCTTFRTEGAEARVIDFFVMRPGGALKPQKQLIRIIEGVRGKVEFLIEVTPRFDYGEVRPWIRHQAARVHSAIGGNDGLLLVADRDLEVDTTNHRFLKEVSVREQERFRLAIEFVRPEELEFELPRTPEPEDLDSRLEETLRWWRRWSGQVKLPSTHRTDVIRSALVLKGLTHAPTGAIAAAATTSLPETPGGERNWDYRYSWIRDASLSSRSLTEIGFVDEADGFRRFVQRSAAGSAHELQIMYGVGGERRLTEILLKLDGYRGARPVRIGNAAANQLQLDAYGTLVDLSWRWHQRGHSPDDDYWRFLVDLVEVSCERWEQPDQGIWEIRGRAKHFVHSKVMCWVAVDRGLRLAEESLRKAPSARWKKVRRQIRAAIEEKGYDRRRGVFTQAFGVKAMDASLLLLPIVGFLPWSDERMVRTTDAIMEELMLDGLVLRYRVDKLDDGLTGEEGFFLPCSFWLVEVLARQERHDQATKIFDRAASTGSELGLFSEEYDSKHDQMLGNYPQALTHLSHIAAAVALSETGVLLEAEPD